MGEYLTLEQQRLATLTARVEQVRGLDDAVRHRYGVQIVRSLNENIRAARESGQEQTATDLENLKIKVGDVLLRKAAERTYTGTGWPSGSA